MNSLSFYYPCKVIFVVIIPGPPLVRTKNRSNEFIANIVPRIVEINNGNLFYAGEGYVGTCLYEKNIIALDNVPDKGGWGRNQHQAA